MKKRTFEDYQKLALILRAVDQMLFESAQLYNRAAYSDANKFKSPKRRKFKRYIVLDFFIYKIYTHFTQL